MGEGNSRRLGTCGNRGMLHKWERLGTPTWEKAKVSEDSEGVG